MLASLLILTLAVLLLVYWFRYACTLALSEKKELACIARVAAVNGLSFLAVQKKLKTGDATLDVLCESLDRDYRVLRYLLRYAAGRRLRPLEQNMLLCDHRILQIWYRCVRRVSARQARKALEERSRILNHLAHRMGQRTTMKAAA
jgi:hypothetical protein